jgi:hypothetical protein
MVFGALGILWVTGLTHASVFNYYGNTIVFVLPAIMI